MRFGILLLLTREGELRKSLSVYTIGINTWFLMTFWWR